MQKKQKGTSLVWYRNDLRINDNTSLTNAINNSEKVIAIYCYDPRHFEVTKFGYKKTEVFRAQFLIDTINDLKQQLLKLNIPLLICN